MLVKGVLLEYSGIFVASRSYSRHSGSGRNHPDTQLKNASPRGTENNLKGKSEREASTSPSPPSVLTTLSHDTEQWICFQQYHRSLLTFTDIYRVPGPALKVFESLSRVMPTYTEGSASWGQKTGVAMPSARRRD